MSRVPHIISKVPRPFGELTHPSWRPEEVALVVLVANACPKYILKTNRRSAIAPCVAHCQPATQELGIIAWSKLHLLALPTLDVCLNQISAKVFVSVLGGYDDRAVDLEARARSK